MRGPHLYQGFNEAIGGTCLFLFFRNWGMKWGRQLRRVAILLIHTSEEETLNG
jgi:hypothetical protein